MCKIISIKNKTTFKKTMNNGRKFVKSGFIVFILKDTTTKNLSQKESQGGFINMGYTVSSKVGNAVTRNRVKRRLRHLANDVINNSSFNESESNLIICFVARYTAYFLDFNQMKREFEDVIKKYIS